MGIIGRESRFGVPTRTRGIIRSSVVRRYQLGFAFHAGSLIVPSSASTPHGTCESAMNAAVFALTSAANDARNFSLSRKR